MKNDLVRTLVFYLLSFMLIYKADGINIQGYLFEVYMNTSIADETFDSTHLSRDINDCASYCLLALGQGNCETASFDSWTKTCRVSSRRVDESAFVDDFSSITVRLLEEGDQIVVIIIIIIVIIIQFYLFI